MQGFELCGTRADGQGLLRSLVRLNCIKLVFLQLTFFNALIDLTTGMSKNGTSNCISIFKKQKKNQNFVNKSKLNLFTSIESFKF